MQPYRTSFFHLIGFNAEGSQVILFAELGPQIGVDDPVLYASAVG
jgi:hypothetical protein